MRCAFGHLFICTAINIIIAGRQIADAQYPVIVAEFWGKKVLLHEHFLVVPHILARQQPLTKEFCNTEWYSDNLCLHLCLCTIRQWRHGRTIYLSAGNIFAANQ